MGLISNGSTVFDAGAMASGFGGAMVFIKKLTASSSSSLSFVNGSNGVVLDSTYKEYLFLYKDIHPSVDGPNPQVQFKFNQEAYHHQQWLILIQVQHPQDLLKHLHLLQVQTLLLQLEELTIVLVAFIKLELVKLDYSYY